MKLRIAVTALFVIAALFGLAGCNGSNSGAQAVRAYSGTASVGDFLTISLNAVARTLSYSNYSNGDTGVIPYTVDSDGSYTLKDPNGNLVSAYEVPNYAMLIEADKAGPNHNTPALVTAVEASPISLATMESKQFNYLQFRTSNGGIDAGSVVIDGSGNVTTSSYWPYGALGMGGAPDAFNSSSFAATDFQEDPSGTFMSLTEQGQGVDYVFGTPSGVFVVDSPNGAILGLKKAATPNFDPSFAGAYKAIYYEKTNASVGQNNQESGTPSLGHASITVDSVGNVTVTDSQSNVLLIGALSPVASTSYLYNGSSSELADPCYGLFTFRIMHGNQPQDVFVTFLENTLLFGSFSPVSQSGSGYQYVYGVGLK